VFSRKDTGLLAKLDLGDGSTLYVGHNGRRELGRGDGPLVDAATLAPADLVGVLRDDKGQIALVADDGSVFVAHDPLGAIEAPRTGPLGADAKPGTTLRSVATGRAAIVAITQDGRLFRSTDYGVSWRPLELASGAKPYGRPVSVALDTKGNGLLLHYPQRLYVTHDDGATWSPIATPGIGARGVRRDGADTLFFEGRGVSSGPRLARLEGSGLGLTTDREVPVYTAPSATSNDKDSKAAKHEEVDRRSERLLLSGDHIVEVAEIFRHGKAREVEVGSAKLGEFPTGGASSADLIGASGMSRHVAGHGADLVYLREDDDVDPSAPTTTVFRSADYGVSWQKEVTLKGAQTEDSNGVDVAVGPRGWTFVTALCPRYSPEGRKCAHRQIRPAGATAYEDMEFDEELTPTAFAFDEPHDRVYVVGIHNGYKYVYESPLGQNRFKRTKLLEVSSYAATALTVDAQGTVRAMAYDSGKAEWVLHRRRAGGEEEAPLYVPLESGTVALAGLRGLVIVNRERGWETADGGETWARVATNGSPQGLACDEAGCINGNAQRVGWDLPAVQDMEKVAATKEPKPAGTHAPSTAPVAKAPLDLVCKPAGGTTQLATTPGSEMVDGRSADVRWASVKHEDLGKTSIVFGTRGSVRESLLLAGAPKPKVPGAPGSSPSSTTGERVLNDGVVAGRFRPVTLEQTGERTLDIDLAWWSASTGRTTHHTLTKVKPFYYYGFGGTPQIVDGGILYQTTSSQPVYFVHDDGRVETFTLPKDATVRNGERLGKRWILADSGSGDVVLSSSDDTGKTWTQKSWGLEDGGTSLLVLLGGKPTLSFARSYLPSALFPVDAVLPDDPPAPVVVDESSIDALCDAKAGTLRVSSYIPADARHLRARVELTPTPAGSSPALPAGRLSAATRITHGTPQGTVCTTAYVLNGSDPKTYDSQTAFLYPEPKGWSGWWFRRVVDAKDSTKKNLVAEPLTCAVGAPEPGR
jgi:hypothetical protein